MADIDMDSNDVEAIVAASLVQSDFMVAARTEEVVLASGLWVRVENRIGELVGTGVLGDTQEVEVSFGVFPCPSENGIQWRALSLLKAVAKRYGFKLCNQLTWRPDTFGFWHVVVRVNW